MLLKIFTYVAFTNLIVYCFQGVFLQQLNVENKLPKVVITKPLESARLPWDSFVPYSIHVNDPEDGNSEYEEITSREVLLMVNYFPKSSDAQKYLSQGIDKMPDPLIQMSKSTCFICHASKAKLIGPSFELIANRYSEDPNIAETLTKKVISGSGSTGIWGEMKMPPHPDLEIEELRKMISWILKNGANPNQTFYIGTEGAFRTKKKPVGEAGVYVLTASYTDHGMTDLPTSNRQGNHTMAFVPD